MMRRVLVAGAVIVQFGVLAPFLAAQPPEDQEGLALIESATRVIADYHRNADQKDGVIRVVYFHPRDRQPLTAWRERCGRILDDVSDFYQQGLQRFGVKDRGLQFERNADGYVFHLVQGALPASQYSYESGAVIRREARRSLDGTIDFNSEHVLFLHGLCHREKDGRYVFNSPYYGGGTPRNGFCHAADCELLDPRLLIAKDRKIIYSEHYYPRVKQTVALFNTWYLGGIAHELGHGLGLPHDAGRPWERAHPATALMGWGNHHYREALWGGKRPAFLSLGSTLRLLSHPLVTKSDRGRFADTRTKLEGLKFTSDAGTLMLGGKIQSEIPAYAVIAYLWRPSSWPGNPAQDHDSVSYPAPVAEKQFNLRIDDFRSGDHRLRVSVLHANGADADFDFHLKVDANGQPNVAELNDAWQVAQAESAVLSGTPHAEELVSVAAIARTVTPAAKGKLQVLRELLVPPTPIDLTTTADKTLSLSDAQWNSASVGWRNVARNHYDRQRQHRNSIYLELKGKFYAKGLYAHSPSSYVFDLQERWKTLTATIGLRDGASENGSAVFVVRGDGKVMYQSPILRAGQSAAIRVDVSRVKKLELTTVGGEGHNHNSWAIWANPKIAR